MGDGFSPDEPEHAKYCEVIQIGIEDTTAEVTIFYTPERGKFHRILMFLTESSQKIVVSFNL